MSDRKRYLVTFQDEHVDAASAAAILGGTRPSSNDVGAAQVIKHLPTGTSVAMLTPEQADKLRNDPRVVEVVEDFDVQAH